MLASSFVLFEFVCLLIQSMTYENNLPLQLAMILEAGRPFQEFEGNRMPPPSVNSWHWIL